jgi:hypothetical protein
VLSDDTGLATAIWEVGSGVLQRHATRQIVDGGGRDLRQHADTAYGGAAHSQIVHHEVATNLNGRSFIPHTHHQPRTEVVHFNPEASQPVESRSIKLQKGGAAPAHQAGFPGAFGQTLVQIGQHAFWHHGCAPL